LKPTRLTPAALPTAEPESEADSAPTIDVEENLPTDAANDDTNGKRESKSKPRPPKVLSDLRPNIDDLRAYMEQKKVGDGDNERYLATAGFLKEKMGIEDISMDHIHTCYRTLSWNTPTDASAPLRRMKSKGLFEKGSSEGMYRLIHVGENRLRDMEKAK
jgi:hypothetical protein